eukprot:TRINITY_DN1638_c0_g1_i1.p1 TRINITY_DN1638_c0_g1~~TRINITY_DN1638_c0_g1_i1.p1  ORF type:complete len:265 (-),score=23.27 TRINITY_DN1638_c0_g1_i1:202-996(-)
MRERVSMDHHDLDTSRACKRACPARCVQSTELPSLSAHPPPMVEPTGVSGPSPTPHDTLFESIIRQSFHPMAQVDPRTGVIVRFNLLFEELASLVGETNRELGLRKLAASFLGDPPADLQRSQATFEIEGETAQLHSVLQPVGQGEFLWSISKQTEPAWPGVAPPDREQSEPDEIVGEHTDPQIKVWADPEHRALGRTRSKLLLWHKYGKKRYDTDNGPVHRTYYRCFKTECEARLKIDLIPGTGEATGVLLKGSHNHPVNFAI